MPVLMLILYAIPPLTLFIGLMGLWKDPSHWRKYLPMCINFLFIGAYCFTPGALSNADLVRYLPQIEYFGTLSLADALSSGKGLFAQYFLFWLFGSLQMEHMVPALTTAIVYAVAGYITCDTAERYNGYQFIAPVFLFQLCMLPYVSIINNVRNVFGFSLVALAVYLDIVKGKRTIFVWFCYVFGNLMHLSVFALLVFRLLSNWGKKYFEIFFLSQFLFSTLVFNIYDLRGIFAFGGDLGNAIQSVIRKLNFYLTTTTHVGALKYQNEGLFSSRTFIVIGTVLFLMIIWYALRTSNRWFQDDKRIYVFVGMIAISAIAFHLFMMVPNYWRFAAVLNVLSGVVLVPLLCTRSQRSSWLNILLFGCFLVAPWLLFFQIRIIQSLSSVGDWILDTLTTNYFTVLFDLIKGLSMI